MEIQGIITQVLEPLTIQGRNGELKKYQFVIETQEQYSKKIHFQVFGDDKWQKMNITLNKLVNVTFDIASREWNGKWYTQCDAWKVMDANNQQPQKQFQQVPQATYQQPQNQQQDDIPF